MKSKDVKDEEVVRIPIAFAMVKLMQTLPPHIMEANLPGYATVCVRVHVRIYVLTYESTLEVDVVFVQIHLTLMTGAIFLFLFNNFNTFLCCPVS